MSQYKTTFLTPILIELSCSIISRVSNIQYHWALDLSCLIWLTHPKTVQAGNQIT